MGVKRIIMYLKLFGAAGLWYWIATKISLLRKPHLVTASLEHLRFPFYLRLNTSDIKVCQDVLLEYEYHVTLIHPPKVIVDAGANIGLTSIFFANQYPSARIFAIEPEPSNFEMLQRNVSRYDNIVPIKAALWNNESEITLVDPGLDKWGFQVQDSASSEAARGEYVTAITVDSLMSRYDIAKIDILKIDIEGAEKEVFESSDSWIENINLIIVELHDRLKQGCSTSLDRATSGFALRREISDCNLLIARDGQLLSQ